jgi:ClpP class serine protease
MDTIRTLTSLARASNAFNDLIAAVETELKANREFMALMANRIETLETKSSQTVSVRIDGDIGERLDALEARIEDFVTEDDVNEQIETAMSDKVTEFDVDSAIEEAIRNLTFTVTVD